MDSELTLLLRELCLLRVQIVYLVHVHLLVGQELEVGEHRRRLLHREAFVAVHGRAAAGDTLSRFLAILCERQTNVTVKLYKY